MANNGDEERLREAESLEEAEARASAREARAAQLKLKGKYIAQAWKELWAGTSSAMRNGIIHRAAKLNKPILNALQAAHLKSVLQNASPGIDWVSEVQRVGLEYDEQLTDIQHRFGIANVASMTEDMERLYDTNEAELRQMVDTGEIPEGKLQEFVTEVYYGGSIGLDNLVNIFGDKLYEMLPALKPKMKAEAVYQYVLTGIGDRKLRIKESYWEVAEYSEFDMVIRLVLIGVLPGDVKARLIEIYAADSSAFGFPPACVNYTGRAYKPDKEVCFDIAVIQDLLTELPVVKSDWAPLPDEFMEDAQDAIMELASSTKWLQNSEWITPKLKETPQAIEAILVTGKTYLGRRDIAKLGGFFKKPLGGWVVPIARKPEIEALARQCGYKTQVIQVDKATMEPPSFAEKVEQRGQKELSKADRLRAQADKLDREATALEQELKPYDDMAFWTEPIHEGERGRRQEKLRNRLRDKMDRIREAQREARELRDKADRLEGHVERKAEDLVYLNNRLEEARANLRGVDRDLEGASSRSGYKPAEGEWRERLLKAKTDYEEQVEYWEKRIAEAGGIQYGPENVKPGDVVKIRGRWATVLSAGPKKVKVSTQGFELRYNYAEVQAVQHPPEAAEEKAEAAPKAAVTAEEAKKLGVTPETPPNTCVRTPDGQIGVLNQYPAGKFAWVRLPSTEPQTRFRLQQYANDELEAIECPREIIESVLYTEAVEAGPSQEVEEAQPLSLSELKAKYAAIPWDVFVKKVYSKEIIPECPLSERISIENNLIDTISLTKATVEETRYGAKYFIRQYTKDHQKLSSQGFKELKDAYLEYILTFRNIITSAEEKAAAKKNDWVYTRAEYIERRLALDQEYQNALKNPDKSNLKLVEDLVRKRAAREHEAAVIVAVAQHKPLPFNVLLDYPELKKAEAREPAGYTLSDLQQLSFDFLPAESETTGIGKQAGIRYRRAKIPATNEAGEEHLYRVQIDTTGRVDIKDLGWTDAERDRYHDREWMKIPKRIQDIVIAHWGDFTNVSQRTTLGNLILGNEVDAMTAQAVLGGNRVKAKLLELFPSVTTYAAAIDALKTLAAPAAEEEAIVAEEKKKYRGALAEFGIDLDELDKAREERWLQFPDGLGRGRKVTDFDLEQLKQGIKTEREHTHDPVMALEIAIDHLTEYPDYYTRLAKMEAEAEREAKGAEAAEEPPSLDDLLKANRKGIEAWIEAARSSYEKGEQTLEHLKEYLLLRLDEAFKKYTTKRVTGEDLDRIAQQLLDMATKPVPPAKEPEVTGAKYCEGCKHFHRTPSGMYCMLPRFEGQYTKACPRREVIPVSPVVKPQAEKPPVAKLKTLEETYPETDTVLVHGVLKHRWRCPYCYRNASAGFCMVHGDVDPLDITQQPEDIAERVIDLSLAQYFASKQPKLSLDQIHTDTGIDSDYLSELLMRKHPDVGIPYQDYYRKQFGIVIEVPVEEEEVKKEGDIEQLIIDYIHVHKSLYHPDEVAKTINKMLLLLNELPFDRQQLYRFDLDKLKASAASVLGGKVEDVESIRADIGIFYQQDNYPMAGLVDYLVTHRGERFTNEVKLAIASLEQGGYPAEKLKVIRSWYH